MTREQAFELIKKIAPKQFKTADRLFVVTVRDVFDIIRASVEPAITRGEVNTFLDQENL